MYNDSKRFQSRNHGSFRDEPNTVGMLPEMEKCFPYSILTKKHQLLQAAVGGANGVNVVKPSPSSSAIASSYLNAALLPVTAGTTGTGGVMNPPAMATPSGTTTATTFEPIPDVNGFYGNAMVTDVGICFSMSNVNLNGHAPTIPLAPRTDVTLLPATHLRLSSPKRERRKSYEDPGPETALLNARRRAAAFVPVATNGRFNPRNILGTAAQPSPNPATTQHHHHLASNLQQQTAFFPASTVYPLAHHPTAAAISLPKQPQLPNMHQVQQPLPRQRSLGLVGKSAYGIVRSTSSDRVRGTGSPSISATGSVSSTIGTLGGLGMARSSPPYFKQPPGGSKPTSVNYYQPPTTAPSAIISTVSSSPYGSAVVNSATNQTHVTPNGYHHRANMLKCLPLTSSIPLADGSPAGAASAATGYDYYRYAIEAAENVSKLQPSQSAVFPSTSTIPPALDESPKPPLMDYNGLHQLFLKCCYNEMQLLPPPTPATTTPVSIMPTDASASTSTGTSLASDSPANAYEYDTDPCKVSNPAAYPTGHYPLTSRSCPSSPNGPHCHGSPALPTTTAAPSTCSTPIDGGRLSVKQQQDRAETSDEDVRPMEICSDEDEAMQNDTIGADERVDDEPKDFSMKTIGAPELVVRGVGGWPTGERDDTDKKQMDDVGKQQTKEFEDCNRKELKAAPKKKWIRHYMNVKKDNYQAPPLNTGPVIRVPAASILHEELQYFLTK